MTDDLARKMHLAEIATVREHLGEQQQAAVPDETDEQRADREETERNHARGDHTHCGVQCEAIIPTDHLRNMLLYQALPGAKGALAELERRAADTGGFGLRGDTEIRAAALREVADRLPDADLPFVSPMGRQQIADWLRRVADETAATATQRPAPVYLSTPCVVCKHPYNWHVGGVCQFDNEVDRCGCRAFAAGARQDGAQR